MKIYEILSFNREILDRLGRAGVRPEDCRYLDLYDDYLKMKADREKMTYIVAMLADRYAVSERKVYAVIAQFGKECTELAVNPPPEE